jgi:acyl carrier protein
MAAETESVVVEEWRAVLDVDGARPEDGFFALGGNSMLAMTLIDRVEERLGIEFPLEALFVDGTLGAVVAACVDRAGVVPRQSG